MSKPPLQTNAPIVGLVSLTENRNRSLDRQFRVLERRLTRLEDIHLTGREVNFSFDCVYAEIDEIEDQIDRRCARLEARFERLETQIDQRFNELNRKLDLLS